MVEHDSINSNAELSWLLDHLVNRVDGARHAVVLSADGLPTAKSHTLREDDADHLSAMASAYQSLAKHTAMAFQGGNVRQTVVEMDHGYLFVTAAGPGACLAVFGEEDADVGLIAYEMNMLVSQVGRFLTAAERTPAQPTPDRR